jgi:hypothetical protein
MINRCRLKTTVLAAVGLLGCLNAAQTRHAGAGGGLVLVTGGKPTAVIVVPERPDATETAAANKLQDYIRKASGAELPVMSESAAAAPGQVRVFIGRTARAAERGIDASRLEPEQFRILAAGNEIILAGAPPGATRIGGTSESAPLIWAVDEILDQSIGVRWLWPGELGTYVPRRDRIAVALMDKTWRPEMEYRVIRDHVSVLNPATQVNPRHLPFRDTSRELYQKVRSETSAWMQHHRLGRRSDFRFGHAFGHWWEKYSKTDPDLFAVPPPGSDLKQPFPAPNRVKLRLSNPKVTEFILEEWRAAGRPAFWNVCPNDGAGFDTSDETRAWDIPRDQAPADIWNGWSELSARYVRFWNQLVARMREERPDVRICTYAYSRYRSPPPAGLMLAEGVIVANVFPYDETFFEQWDGWYQKGATNMVLRPQWLLHGADAPYLPLEEIAKAQRHARDHGLVGMQIGAIYGYWGAAGLTPYLIARLNWRPEMTKDAIVDEYCAAFGAAAPHVRRYFRYWEDFSREAAYPVENLGEFRTKRGGLYEQVVEQHNLTRNVNNRGIWHVMPYLYPDARLAPALAMLDEAAAAVRNEREEYRERVRFLRDGLEHFRVARDTIELGMGVQRDRSLEAAHARKFDELRALRRELTPRHVVWGDAAFWREGNRGAFTIPNKFRTQEVDATQEN